MSALLKFLTGSQAGAELLLENGSYELGSGDQAEVALADATVKPSHARITISGDTWRVEALAGAEVGLDGRAISQPTACKPYQVVTIGGVNLALGPDGPWERMPSPPERFSSALDKTPDNRSDGGLPAPPPHPEPPAPEPPEEPGGEPAPSEGKEEKPAGAAKKKSRFRPLPFALLAAVLAGALFRFGDPGRLNRLLSYLAGEGRPLERAAEFVERQGYPTQSGGTGEPDPGTIKLVETPGGIIEAVGLVAGEEERESLDRKLKGAGGNLKSRLRSAESELAETNAVLARNHPGTRLIPENTKFRARLFGLAADPAAAAAAYQAARQNLDNRIRIRRDPLVWSELRPEAERKAARAGANGLRFELENGKVVARNEFWPDPNARQAWLNSIRIDYGEAAAELFANAGSAEALPLPAGQPADPRYPAIAIKPPEPVAEPESPEKTEPPIETAIVDKEATEDSPAGKERPVGDEDDEEVPPAPPRESWLVAQLIGGGFVDQRGRPHRLGEYLLPNLCLIDVWSGGIVLRRSGEVVFVNLGDTITAP
ncbi:MAG: hypothetical protein LBU64_03205 [Planctomycetota bacterium]|nr:hypothetical protein [Planctomycetota bacterium]